jgi:hypothetical protein
MNILQKKNHWQQNEAVLALLKLADRLSVDMPEEDWSSSQSTLSGHSYAARHGTGRAVILKAALVSEEARWKERGPELDSFKGCER